MYINWLTWIIFFHDRICYLKKLGATRILQLSQGNGKLPLPWWRQGIYPVITIYGNIYIDLVYHTQPSWIVCCSLPLVSVSDRAVPTRRDLILSEGNCFYCQFELINGFVPQSPSLRNQPQAHPRRAHLMNNWGGNTNCYSTGRRGDCWLSGASHWDWTKYTPE